MVDQVQHIRILIEYVTIATTGDAADFGDLTALMHQGAAFQILTVASHKYA